MLTNEVCKKTQAGFELLRIQFLGGPLLGKHNLRLKKQRYTIVNMCLSLQTQATFVLNAFTAHQIVYLY